MRGCEAEAIAIIKCFDEAATAAPPSCHPLKRSREIFRGIISREAGTAAVSAACVCAKRR
ncbi:MAG TPA: hypothetical protein DFS52_04635 [Myxococcales bacterium]|jgi:hypothetical protein|nr:hypothetical protein [Myxococcales bacterium]